jgi:hypothetical protein
MPQISLYIDEKTLQKVERAAKRQHLSISKWVAEQIRAKVDPIYPVDFEDLFGSIQDDTFVAPSKLNFNQDADRLQF